MEFFGSIPTIMNADQISCLPHRSRLGPRAIIFPNRKRERTSIAKTKDRKSKGKKEDDDIGGVNIWSQEEEEVIQILQE